VRGPHGALAWAELRLVDDVIRKLERIVGLAATAVLVVLHVVFLAHAGALWRDEVNVVNLATMPLPELWGHLEFDSTPLAFLALLRAWIGIGLGATDLPLQILGCVLGLGVLGVLWWNAQRLGYGVPLIALALLGFNAAVITYGDSVRGHGLGMLTALLTFGLTWKLVDRPSARNALLALVSAVVSVHSLFFNAVILLAACAGGAAVALSRRQWKTIGLLAGVGLVSALSLLPYTVVFQSRKAWNFMIEYPIDLRWIWERFVEATRLTGPFALWLWIGLPLIGIITVLAASRRGVKGSIGKPAEVGLFCGVALVTGVIAYLLFLLRLSYTMQPWYFLALMALVASCLDGALLASARQPLRISRVVVAITAMTLALGPVWQSVHVRKTNLDLIAAKLAQSSQTGDLILVMPWYLGITFDRYYRGAAEWLTIPPLPSHKLHRWDQLKEAMASRDAMKPVLSRIETALQSGRRVWWIGGLAAPPEGQGPPVLPPATEAPWGFREWPYYQGWGLQAGYVFRRHALRAQAVPVPSDAPVSPYESPTLDLIEGWRAGGEVRAAANQLPLEKPRPSIDRGAARAVIGEKGRPLRSGPWP